MALIGRDATRGLPWAVGLLTLLMGGCSGGSAASADAAGAAGTTSPGAAGTTSGGAAGTTSGDGGGGNAAGTAGAVGGAAGAIGGAAGKNPDAASDADAGTDASASDGGAPCPTAPPFDTNDPGLRARCTRRIYVAGGDDFRLTISVDEGKTWQRVQPVNITGDDFVNDILVDHGVVSFIGLPGVYASADRGQTFALVAGVTHAGFDTYGGQFTASATQALLTDNEGTYLSSNGAAWASQTPFPDASHPKGFGGHFHGTAFGNGTYVVFQDNGVFRTFDGTTWRQGALPSASATDLASARAVVYAKDKFVAVGSDKTGAFSTTSADGETWSAFQYKDATNAALAGQPTVVFDGTHLMIFTIYGGKAAYSSTDGATWTKRTLTVDLDDAVFEDGVFFGTSGTQLLFSADGTTWTSVHDLGTDETAKINGPRLAVGRVLE